MITARQVREARELLGWYPLALARKAGIQFATVNKAELTGGTITPVQARKIQRALEAAGVEIHERRSAGSEVEEAGMTDAPYHYWYFVGTGRELLAAELNDPHPF